MRSSRHTTPTGRWRKGATVLLVTALLGGLVGSCGWGPEKWEPSVLVVVAEQNGQSLRLRLDRTGPSLEFNEGDDLVLKSFELQMLLVQRTSGGSVMIRTGDVPPMPESALHMVAKVSATVRDFQDGKRCWNMVTKRETEWKQVEPGTWTISLASSPWILRPNWDEIRIDVAFRSSDRPDIPAEEYLINYIVLTPNAHPINDRIGHNIFMFILDTLRGVSDCT
jgi:hypothetical protein